MKDKDVQLLVNEIITKAQETERYMVAVAGPPASGKSTLSEKLSLLINQQFKFQVSEVIPMDGFHLDNTSLDKLSLRHRKGAENTFDSEGFTKMIKTLMSTSEPIRIPLFDRQNDACIPDAKVISSKQRILIVEGNYLLLNSKPWSDIHGIYGYKLFVNPGIKVIKERLINRWKDNGYDLEGARHRALSNDIPNAEFVLEYSIKADLDIN